MTNYLDLVHRLTRRRALSSIAAALGPVALAGIAPTLTRAQDTAHVSTPSAAAPSPETLSLIQYIHPEKVYFWVPGFSDEAVLAGLYDLDVADYEEIKAGFAAAARGAAEELLTDAS